MQITISREVPAETLAAIQAHVEHNFAYEPRLNGQRFEIVRGDFTEIDDDSTEANRLFREIVSIIQGE